MSRPIRMVAAVFAAAAAAAVSFVSVAAPARAAAAPVSRISSPAQQVCLDVSTTDPSHYFLDTYGAVCNGSKVQAFTFAALASAQPNTFHIISRSTGQCMIKYRQGIRQGSCNTDAGWTFQRIGTTGHRYNILVPSTVGTAYPGCIQVNPQGNGYPGAMFTEVLCTGATSQVLALTTAP